MLVKDLIEKLKLYNEDNEVLIQTNYGSVNFHIDCVIKKDRSKKELVFIREGRQEVFDDKKEDYGF